MQYKAAETLPTEEAARRIDVCRAHLAAMEPQVSGLLIFSRLNLYYFTGSYAQGMLWLPLSGQPVLMVRRGHERCRLESPLQNIVPFRSYGDIVGICADSGSPISGRVAAEMGGLSWTLSNLLRSKLKDLEFVSGDMAITRTRAVKSSWELAKMRLAGQRHSAFYQELAAHIKPGMSELEMSHTAYSMLLRAGHSGVSRLSGLGDELVLGHMAVGDNAGYPSHFDGVMGLMGVHPAAPFMGNAGSIWGKKQLLAIDFSFVLEGYNSDKTRIYWSGSPDSLPDEVRRAHEVCLSVQDMAASSLKPGAVPSSIYEKALTMAEQAGYKDTFMGHGANKVQFIGHGIGLAIDEYPAFARRFDSPLEEGMTVALEPKIFLPGFGLTGVEDTFEITANGASCLSGGERNIIFVD